MQKNGATRQQVADVIGVGVKTIYKYFPAQRDDKKIPLNRHRQGDKYFITFLLCATLHTGHLLRKFLNYRVQFNRSDEVHGAQSICYSVLNI